MHFRIHNEGWVFVIISFILTIIVFPFFNIIGFLLLIISCCIFYFFRDPIRSIPKEDVIVSPADGQIVFIGESDLPEECNISGKFLKISIFLDVFNVHVNRIPTTGKVKKIEYVEGKFFRANIDKSSKENERNIILIENENKETFVVCQIAGLIARRIVCEIKEQQKVIKGDRFGIIKFGSRVDIYLPSNFKPLIGYNQIVVGGETILANPKNIKEISNSIKN